MASGSERKFAPYCGHNFTVAHVRGDAQVAIVIVADLRRAYERQYYVSDPYQDSDGASVFALCSDCVKQAGSASG